MSRKPPHEHLTAAMQGILEYADFYLTPEQRTALCMDVALISLRRLPMETMEQLTALAAQCAASALSPHTTTTP